MKNRYISPRAKVIVLDAESELMTTSDIVTPRKDVPGDFKDEYNENYNVLENGVSNGNGIWNY